MPLIDDHGRRIRKLRVSLLDACNFRCFYCMPTNPKFMSPSKWLPKDNIISIVKALIPYGIEELRLTGGEPTLRPEFRQIVEELSPLPFKKLGLTTNGLLLSKHLNFLKQTTCQHLNISLDSLNRDKFNKITRSKGFDLVMDSIIQAREMEFDIKLNIILMKGINDDEILDFIKFSQDTSIEVRFLEMMRIGQACANQNEKFMPASEAIDIIKNHHRLQTVKVPLDATAFSFTTEKGAKIGFIASESQPFCSNCSRWRLSAEGFLRACLMKEDGVDLRGVPVDQYDRLLNELLAKKPSGRVKEVSQDMNQIGG